MNEKSKEVLGDLFKKFREIRYTMGTGNPEWWDIKTDYELDDDEVAGTISFLDADKPHSQAKINENMSMLLDIKKRVEEYDPIDAVETEEKEKILRKIAIGLEIYNLLLKE